jgi:N-acylneuraminate cytidylyltransferase
MRLVAVIPVKHESERVKAKNFRDFYNGESLLDIKIKQILKCGLFDEIYISSDSIDAKQVALKNGIKFLERNASFCNNITPWSDVIYEVVNNIPEPGNTHIAWCHTTCPLFNNFEECVLKYKRIIKSGEFNGLVAVSECKEFILDEKATPVNYSWGPWHRYSQNLKKHFFVSGAAFITSKAEMIKNRYVISTDPYLFEATALESIDIDTEFDYEFAKYTYKRIVLKL